MSLLSLPLQGNRARYDITVVATEGSESGPAVKRFSSKVYSSVKNIGTKVGAAFTALMLAGWMLLGTLGTAPAAKADDWGMMNGLRDAIYETAYFNAGPEDRGLGVNTTVRVITDG